MGITLKILRIYLRLHNTKKTYNYSNKPFNTWICWVNSNSRKISSDIPITYYVAGYVCRRLIKCSKCQDSQSLFSKNQQSLSVIIEDNGATQEEMKQGQAFVDAISRGGLIKPSDLVFVTCVHASDLCRHIRNDDQLKEALLESLFVEVFFSKLEESESTNSILEVSCGPNHSSTSHVRRIGVAMFNLFAKNLTAESNSAIHRSRKRNKSEAETNQKRDPKLMKLKKLQSLWWCKSKTRVWCAQCVYVYTCVTADFTGENTKIFYPSENLIHVFFIKATPFLSSASELLSV